MEKEWKSGEAIWHMKQAERNALDVAAMNKLNEIVDVARLRQRAAEWERGLDSAYQLADHYRDERDALKQQRDELVKVLERSLESFEYIAKYGNSCGHSQLRIPDLKAAIASVKEK